MPHLENEFYLKVSQAVAESSGDIQRGRYLHFLKEGSNPKMHSTALKFVKLVTRIHGVDQIPFTLDFFEHFKRECKQI